jgi:hypothetical protein
MSGGFIGLSGWVTERFKAPVLKFDAGRIGTSRLVLKGVSS